MVGFRNQTFDDRDTGSLVYQGFWFNQGTWNASNTGDTGTLTSSNDPNANVTFVSHLLAMFHLLPDNYRYSLYRPSHSITMQFQDHEEACMGCASIATPMPAILILSMGLIPRTTDGILQ